MKHLYILRGPSGCGKSRLAKKLVIPVIDEGGSTAICSADNYFTTLGQYEFDATKLGDAHKQCKERAENHMAVGFAAVVIDNTNMQVWEYMKYVELAEKYGYSYSIIVVGRPWIPEELAARAKHGMTAEQIRVQISKFAHWV